MELDFLFVLKLFLAVGPLLGWAVLELVLMRRDRVRRAQGLPLLPGRFASEAEARIRTK